MAHIRLFCFPYAGGGAMTYRTWGEILPATIEVCPIQLPGREDRLKEPPFTELPVLVQTLIPHIRSYLDKPFAFFGHSMGALIAYVLTHELWRQTDRLPVHLFLSAHGAPDSSPVLPPIHQLTDSAFLIALQRRYRSVPALLWHDAELRALFLPMLRADMTLFETYVYHPMPLLPCPLTVYGGSQDMLVSQANLDAWRNLGNSHFDLRMFAGNHFYLNDTAPALLNAIGTALNAYVE
jgi:medium-chain acyl-[acyl-carrier-protein] hydrolase